MSWPFIHHPSHRYKVIETGNWKEKVFVGRTVGMWCNPLYTPIHTVGEWGHLEHHLESYYSLKLGNIVDCDLIYIWVRNEGTRLGEPGMLGDDVVYFSGVKKDLFRDSLRGTWTRDTIGRVMDQIPEHLWVLAFCHCTPKWCLKTLRVCTWLCVSWEGLDLCFETASSGFTQ